jgi:hypothetical protein
MQARTALGQELADRRVVGQRPQQLDGLLKALAAGGWHDIEAEDGTVRVNLAIVVYVKTDRDQHRVGFGV